MAFPIARYFDFCKSAAKVHASCEIFLRRRNFFAKNRAKNGRTTMARVAKPALRPANSLLRAQIFIKIRRLYICQSSRNRMAALPKVVQTP